MDQTNVEALAAQQYPQCHHRVALVVGDDHTDALARTKRRAIRRRSEQGQIADDGFPQLTVSSRRLTGGLGGRPLRGAGTGDRSLRSEAVSWKWSDPAELARVPLLSPSALP